LTERALFHLWKNEPAQAHLGEELEVEIGVLHFVCQILGGAARPLAGVVDQDVDLAGLGHHRIRGQADIGRLGDVAADR